MTWAGDFEIKLPERIRGRLELPWDQFIPCHRVHEGDEPVRLYHAGVFGEDRFNVPGDLSQSCVHTRRRRAWKAFAFLPGRLLDLFLLPVVLDFEPCLSLCNTPQGFLIGRLTHGHLSVLEKFLLALSGAHVLGLVALALLLEWCGHIRFDHLSADRDTNPGSSEPAGQAICQIEPRWQRFPLKISSRCECQHDRPGAANNICHEFHNVPLCISARPRLLNSWSGLVYIPISGRSGYGSEANYGAGHDGLPADGDVLTPILDAYVVIVAVADIQVHGSSID